MTFYPDLGTGCVYSAVDAQAALWQALADGRLDIVSADHGPRPRQPGELRRGVSSIEAR